MEKMQREELKNNELKKFNDTAGNRERVKRARQNEGTNKTRRMCIQDIRIHGLRFLSMYRYYYPVMIITQMGMNAL